MSQQQKHANIVDRFIGQFDRALQTLTPDTAASARQSPAHNLDEAELTAAEKRHAAGLMRINHTGEVCAQALYQGQGLTAKLPKVRAAMDKAAAEEVDHLVWCEQRVHQLNQSTSVLNPIWYGLSFGIGAAAGLVSDKISLGFVAATEDQVCQHLQDHLGRLPAGDNKSRAIVTKMIEDEQEHGRTALDAGGLKFPAPLRWAMRQSAKIMTTISYKI